LSLSLFNHATHRPPRLEATGRTHPGRRRSQNEDALAVDVDLGMFVVADGLGGHASGEVASRLAVTEMSAMLSGSAPGAPAPLLVQAIQHANARVFAAGQAPAMHGMGTTVVAAFVRGSRVAVAHVGDSRAYLLRGDRLQRLTEDHTVANHCRLAGLDPVTRPNLAPYLHSLTRAVGTSETIDVDVRILEPHAGDVLLLCSDGLTGAIDDEEISDILSECADLDVAAEQLVGAANESGGPDNITVALLRWGREPVHHVSRG
jgi:serine/threonine protein phosphatase PrpC